MRWLILFAALMATSLPGAAMARGGGSLQADQLLPQRAPQRTLAPGLSAAQAAQQVQQRHGGRVLSVQDTAAGYRVKVLREGEVRSFDVNR